MNSAWIVRHRPRPGAQVRLYCLPYAGSGASVFRTWADVLPASIEVCAIQLPGRETRFREPAFSDLRRLADVMADAMVTLLQPPYAIFGHSYGAWVAFELASQLQQRKAPEPRHLFVSGRRGPGLPDPFPLLHPLPDPEFQLELERRFGGTAPEIALHTELMQLLLPSLRADMIAVETYQPAPGVRVGCAISVFGGQEDESTTRPELEAWRARTTGAFHLDVLPGAHFFIGPERDNLLRIVTHRLQTSDSPNP